MAGVRQTTLAGRAPAAYNLGLSTPAADRALENP